MIDAEKLERREILKNLLGRKAIPIPSYLTSTGGSIATEGGSGGGGGSGSGSGIETTPFQDKSFHYT